MLTKTAKGAAMIYQTITYTHTDDIAVLTLNRPEVMNALTTAMRQELLNAIKTAIETVRVLVITGAGRAFCSGQDLDDATNLGAVDMERLLREEYEPLLNAIYDCPIPTIAAVNGAAVGAGANLALAADIVIATHSASFAQSFTRIGLIPDAGGTYWLPRQIGMPRAMGAALFADKITASQAAQSGMIYEAVPDADFSAHWHARAVHLATGPTAAYARVKQAMRASPANDLNTQLALEARLQGQCGQTADFREGVAAFLEKRRPYFTGR
jgi:2-(1,2-epoxy-1,2-dihydrophenyl)acetyl-CoA isomerase